MSKLLACIVIAVMVVPVWGAAVASQPATGAGVSSVECSEEVRLDVSLVIDRSGSMSGDAIATARTGATRLVENLSADDKSGLVSYASSATLDVPLGFDHAATITAIQALYASGSTATGTAIDVSHNDAVLNGRTDVRRVMIVLTDGYTNTGLDPVTEATQAKADGLEIFAIGLGSSVNEPELRAIASEPVDEHFYHPLTTDELIAVFEQLTESLKESAVVAEAYGAHATVETSVGAEVVLHKLNQQTKPEGGAGTWEGGTFPVGSYTLELGVVETAADGAADPTKARSWASTRIETFVLRDSANIEIVRADALVTGSQSTADPWTAGSQAKPQTQLVGLVVQGRAFAVAPAPNTVVPVGTLGSLVINEQVAQQGTGYSGLTVNAVHLTLDSGAGERVEIIVASSFSGASCAVPPAFQNPEADADDLVNATLPGTGGLPPVGPGVGGLCVYSDDLETGAPGWSHFGSRDEWELGTPTYGPSAAASGSNAWGTDLDGAYENGADQVLVSPQVHLASVPPGVDAFLMFRLWFSSETYYDGGVVEADDGTTVKRLTPEGSPAYYPYTSRPGGAAWSGTVGGWHDVTMDVSEYAGKSVSFRFRLATDSSVTGPGFYLDDVRVCAELPTAAPEEPSVASPGFWALHDPPGALPDETNSVSQEIPGVVSVSRSRFESSYYADSSYETTTVSIPAAGVSVVVVWQSYGYDYESGSYSYRYGDGSGGVAACAGGVCQTLVRNSAADYSYSSKSSYGSYGSEAHYERVYGPGGSQVVVADGAASSENSYSKSTWSERAAGVTGPLGLGSVGAGRTTSGYSDGTGERTSEQAQLKGQLAGGWFSITRTVDSAYGVDKVRVDLYHPQTGAHSLEVPLPTS